MVPAAIMYLDALPLTSSGKINREELPAPVLRSGPHTRPPHTGRGSGGGVRRMCAAERAGVTTTSSPSALIHGRDPGAELGHEFGIDIPVRWDVRVAHGRDPRPPSRRRECSGGGQRGDEDAAGAPVGYPCCGTALLTATSCRSRRSRSRMWIVNRFDTESTIFHIPFALRLRGTLDVAALSDALVDVLDRHEDDARYIRTARRPIQQVLPLDRITSSDRSGPQSPRPVAAEDVLTRIGDPRRDRIDVSDRFRWHRRCSGSTTPTTSWCVVHHIAADGSSSAPHRSGAGLRCPVPRKRTRMAAAAGDLSRLHPLASTNSWAVKVRPGVGIGCATRYWRIRLQGLPDLLALPTDRPRPAATAADNGGHLTAEVAPDQWRGCGRWPPPTAITRFHGGARCAGRAARPVIRVGRHRGRHTGRRARAS